MYAFLDVHLIDTDRQVLRHVRVRFVVVEIHFLLFQRLDEAIDGGIAAGVAPGRVGKLQAMRVEEGDIVVAQILYVAI